MTATRFLDRFNSQIVSVHTTALVYTTLLNINPAVFGSVYQLGLRARGVYRNVGSNTGYGGYCETVASWNETQGIISGSNVSGNSNALGGPSQVGGLAVIPIIFVGNGATIDVQGSGLDGDFYKWFVTVDVEVLQITP